MAFEDFRARIAMLMGEIAANPEDAHQLRETLREKLFEMQALGMPLPADLVRLEDYLEETTDVDEGAADPEPEPSASRAAPAPPRR